MNPSKQPSEQPSEQHGGRRRVEGALRGTFRSARMSWTDPESGERWTIGLQADSGMIASLGQSGFVLLDDSKDSAGASAANVEPVDAVARVRPGLSRAPLVRAAVRSFAIESQRLSKDTQRPSAAAG